MRSLLAIILLLSINHTVMAQTDTGRLSGSFQNTAIFSSKRVAVPDTGKSKRLIICGPSRGRLFHSAFIAIFAKNKLIYRGDTSGNSKSVLGFLPPKIVSDVNVLAGNSSTAKYGDMAKYGSVEIFIDKKKDRQAYRMFTRQLKEMQKAQVK